MDKKIKMADMTLSERAKYWRFKCWMRDSKIKYLERKNKLIKTKLEFLLKGKSSHINFGRGKWLKMLKAQRKK